MKRKNAALVITGSIIIITFLSVVVTFSSVSVSADPFGIFNYDNPYLVKIQGLRAHLFETHDAAHKSNSSEIIMHSNMANKETSHLLQNLSTPETKFIKDTQKMKNTFNLIKMQLTQINELSNNKNMTGVMVNLKNMDKQLVLLVDLVNTNGNNQTTIKT
ncbi:MAG TPA: hypothetical protein VJ697_09380 [Nitrososphaeraceae archaeon]|nr:hypothetical protein [Nitrososphaeraceae archaeon]